MSKRIKIFINYIFGPLLFAVISFSLYRQISRQPDLALRWGQIRLSWQDWRLWVAVFLMILNWGIESKKWQLLVNHVQRFDFARAFKSVLSGCGVTMLTPNRIGEFSGRILFVAEEHRIKAISLSLVGSLSQLLVTLILGCTGLLYLRFLSHTDGNSRVVLPEFWEDVLIYLSIGITGVLLLFYLRIGWLVRMMERVPPLRKIVYHIRVVDEFSDRHLVHILSLSFIRYLVFVLQYVLMLHVMQINIPFTLCFWLIAVFYLVMAVAPTLGFVDLPIRVSASWVIFRLFTDNQLGISTASLGIWLINLVIPGIVGSLLILSIKLVKEK